MAVFGMDMKDASIFRLPKSNIGFWKEKIEHNVSRDIRNEEKLRALGWKVIRVWECDIKTVATRQTYLEKLYSTITSPVSDIHWAHESDSNVISIAAKAEYEYHS